MHEEVSQAERDDLRTQAGVLALVVSEYPTLLTLRNLMMEMCDDPEDGVVRAVRDLTAVGLLRREGDSVLPTRATLAHDRLPL